MSTNDSHSQRLARVRLLAIVKSRLEIDRTASSASAGGASAGAASDLDSVVFEPSEFGAAVGGVLNGVAWVLITGRHERGLGPALMWALRNNATALKLFTEQNAGDLARGSKNFNFTIEVFAVDSSTAVSAATPSLAKAVEVSVADEMFAAFIKSSGAEVIREHGVMSGEVVGLEVCRVVPGESGDSRIEIGVGVHDRETFQLVHGQTATIESLRRVVTEVAARRVVGAQVHPLNQLARERILRHVVCQSPNLVGAQSLSAAQPPSRRRNLKEIVPCVASGISQTGQKVVVIFSVGIDPDVVAFGADAREQINSNAELVFACPTRDIVPAVTRLAEMLNKPARFVGVDILGAQAQPQV